MNRLLVVSALLAAFATARADWLSNWEPSTGTIHYGGVIFNVNVSGSSDVVLTGNFNLNLDANSLDATDTTEEVAVYYRTGTYLGHIATDGSQLSDWTLYGTSTVNVAGDGNRSLLSLGNTLALTQGQTYGFAIFALDGGATGIGYRTGTGAVTAAPQNSFNDGYLTLSGGVAKGFGFASNPFATHNGSSTQRLWAGEIEYNLAAPVPEPATIAALGLGGLALLRRRKKS